MRFTKMHGIGNDYVYVNLFEESVVDPETLAQQVSDRRFGIGSDGLILICPSDKADFKMRMFNADGSESEMCGNGIRCVGKYIRDHGLTDKDCVTIETLAGIKSLTFNYGGNKVESVKVDMGRPVLERSEIPMIGPAGKVVDEPLTVDGVGLRVTAVSMGNPHCVIQVSETSTAPVTTLGPKIEICQAFPRRTNVEFIQIISRNEMNMRVWERGSGETMACGTGTCASVVASVLNDLTDRLVKVHLLGGDLVIEWAEDDHVYMTGPAVEVYHGELDLGALRKL